MANLVPDEEQQDEDVKQWLLDIEPIIEMNQDLKRERQEQLQEKDEDEK